MTVNQPLSGFLLVDKPTGPTSFQIVAHVRSLWGGKKSRLRVGHAGTLDPRASGLLIIAVGQATRLLSSIVGLDKTYEVTITLGATTTTDDAEAEPTPWLVTTPPTREFVEHVLQQFVGDQQQVPPNYSAKKQAGIRLYKLARQGKKITSTAHPVAIYSIRLQRYNYPTLELTVHCSSGTYIRSLARDIGTALKTGGYVQSLRRTTIGPFRVSEAVALAEFSTKQNLVVAPDKFLSRIQPR